MLFRIGCRGAGEIMELSYVFRRLVGSGLNWYFVRREARGGGGGGMRSK